MIAHPESLSIFLLRSDRMLSRTAKTTQSLYRWNKKNVPDAVMQSAMDRSSRMDKARGNLIVTPKWYWSISHGTSARQCVQKHCIIPEVVISAALTFSMNELTIIVSLCQQVKCGPYSSGSRYKSPLSSYDLFAVCRNSGGYFGSHTFQGFCLSQI